ncbi:MAG: hypothetical protein AAB870_00060 [Patescibacteria group bacterium]
MPELPSFEPAEVSFTPSPEGLKEDDPIGSSSSSAVETESSSESSLESFDSHVEKVMKGYNDCVTLFNKLGYFHFFETGEMGIVVEGKEYPFPSRDSILKELKENKELYETKMEQGFTKLQITPLFMPIATLQNTLKEQIVKHHTQGTLIEEGDPKKPFPLNPDDPLYVWDQWAKGEESGTTIYFPKQFDKTNHGGYTKNAMIQSYDTDPGTAPASPFSILLLQENDMFPATKEEAQKNEQGGRIPLENKRSPNEYLQVFTNTEKDPMKNPYAGESGLTIEEELTLVLTRLHNKQGLPHIYENNHATWLTGNYDTSGGGVAYARAYRDYKQFNVSGNDPDRRNGRSGVVAAVGVGKRG